MVETIPGKEPLSESTEGAFGVGVWPEFLVSSTVGLVLAATDLAGFAAVCAVLFDLARTNNKKANEATKVIVVKVNIFLLNLTS